MIKVLMAYDSGRKQVGDIASKRASDYARANGHSFVLHDSLVVPESSGQTPYWNKVYAVQKELSEGGQDWIMWLDADAFVVDLSFDLTSILDTDKDMLCSTDIGGYCVGVFIVRQCAWAAKLFDAMSRLGHINQHSPNNDQATFQMLAKWWDSVGGRIAGISEELVQNPMTKSDKTPFIYHYWTQWNNHENIAKKMSIIESRGWCPEARLINSPAA